MHTRPRPDAGRILNAAAAALSALGAGFAGLVASSAGYGDIGIAGIAVGAGLTLLTATGWIAASLAQRAS